MTLVLDDTIKQDIQGFVTSAYGHTYHAAYLFLAIDDAAQARAWLKSILPDVLSAESWRKGDAPAGEKPPKIYPREIINVAFSYSGLGAIGLSDLSLKSFPAQMQSGMTEYNRSLQLGDTQESHPDNWEVGGTKNPDFHILLILHAGHTADAKDELDTFVAAQKAALSGVSVVHEEIGYRRADDKELFGFKDGIAQPKVEGINLRNAWDELIKDPVKR
jgi:deferrochelatase/peroxidase EfeB